MTTTAQNVQVMLNDIPPHTDVLTVLDEIRNFDSDCNFRKNETGIRIIFSDNSTLTI